MRIALTGGIACGKSRFAEALRKLGVETLDADDIVHELVPDDERRRLAKIAFKNPEVLKGLEARLHPLVEARFDEWLGGEVRDKVIGNREEVRDKVIGNREEGGDKVMGNREEVIAKNGDGEPQASHLLPFTSYLLPSLLPLTSSLLPKLRVAIIPLLFEVHWEKKYDIICAVICSKEKQIERMMQRRGLTRQEAEERLAAQMPTEEKAAKSHYVIHNEGTTEELERQAAEFVSWLAGQIEKRRKQEDER